MSNKTALQKEEDEKRGLFPEEITNSYSLEYMRDVLFNPPVYKKMLEKVKPEEGKKDA